MARPSRAKPADQLKRHRLDQVDHAAKTAVCRICGPARIVRRGRAWACEAKERRGRHEHLLTRYGISEDEYNQLLAENGPGCAICGVEPLTLHVDHDHVTGKVRGLLCGPCNRGIGMLKDDIGLLKQAIVYLTRS